MFMGVVKPTEMNWCTVNEVSICWRVIVTPGEPRVGSRADAAMKDCANVLYTTD